jgi:polyhydroxybutyrate depolymerase
VAARGVRRRLAVALAGIALAGVPAGCAAILGARSLRSARPDVTSFHTVRVRGKTRSFLLHLPPVSASRPLPLILVFHGHGGNAGTAMEQTRMNEAADRRGFAVAYPNGSGRFGYVSLSWNAQSCCGYAERRRADELAFVDTLVDALVRGAGVDRDRVFAAGFSVGGMIALRLACERAESIAGVADVAGAMPDTSCHPARPVPVLLFQGEDDDELRQDHAANRRRHGHRAYSTSLERALAFWTHRDRCARAIVRDSAAAYTRLAGTGCARGMTVALYTVRGHPHAWPGGRPTWALAPRPAPGLDATALILDEFGRVGRAATSLHRLTSPRLRATHRR